MDRKIILLCGFLFLSVFMINCVKSETFDIKSHQKVIEKIIKNETKVEKNCVEDLRRFYDQNLTIHEGRYKIMLV